MYYIGIDVGGITIKIGIVDKAGNILSKSAIKTENINPDLMIQKVSLEISKLLQSSNLSFDDVKGIGVGCPGAINGKLGVVKYSSNLKWTDFNLKQSLEKYTNKLVRVANDADAAALGEIIFGVAKNYNNVIMLTLGTGVGGGIIIDKKLYEGSNGMVGELGHIIMRANGHACGCGRKGCFEQYASATALIRQTKSAMLKNRDSLMWQGVQGDINNVDGKLSFSCAKLGDKTAIKVVDKYVSYLSEGILDYCNIFRPDAVVLGGGISKEGEFLTEKVVKYLEKYDYGYKGTPKTAILTAGLKNDAGILGAASLVAEEF
ncbi:MAG: ROK family protein [Clostridiales bacterium]|nr:ROK family protein [Clostridiales bacterium]